MSLVFAVDNSTSPFIDPTTSAEANNVNVIGTPTQQKDAAINVVKSFVNWVLGILAFIALIIVIYGGFLMVTSAGEDDSYNKWRTILKYALIGLALIGLARFIVSIIFWLVNKTTENGTIAWANSDT